VVISFELASETLLRGVGMTIDASWPDQVIVDDGGKEDRGPTTLNGRRVSGPLDVGLAGTMSHRVASLHGTRIPEAVSVERSALAPGPGPDNEAKRALWSARLFEIAVRAHPHGGSKTAYRSRLPA
jgi:hypothetical protein